jgi:hypothetical protein
LDTKAALRGGLSAISRPPSFRQLFAQKPRIRIGGIRQIFFRGQFSIDKTKYASFGEYGVYVLNLTSGTTNNQDQLILVPDGGLTVMLLGLGVGGLALISRKFKA